MWMLPPMADETQGATEAPAPDPAPPPPAPKAPPSPARPPTEAEIDSPDRRTLGLLGAVLLVTVASWGSARFSCNMHPPESKPPPKLGIERLTATAKDAAIEFVQRWQSSDYDGALEIAAGEAEADMGRQKAACAADASACARRREAAAGLMTVVTVVHNTGFVAQAKATTHLKGQTHSYAVTLARNAMLWKVTGATPE